MSMRRSSILKVRAESEYSGGALTQQPGYALDPVAK